MFCSLVSIGGGREQRQTAGPLLVVSSPRPPFPLSTCDLEVFKLGVHVALWKGVGPVASVCALKRDHTGLGGQEEVRESLEGGKDQLSSGCTLESPLAHFHSVLEGTYTVS